MKHFEIIWKLEQYKIPLMETPGKLPWTNLVSLLEHLGREGREALIGVLICTYREDLKKELKAIEKLERANFRKSER